MELKNLLFQSYWHGFGKKGWGTDLNPFNKWRRNITAYSKAKYFGTLKKLFIGDSNCEALDNFKDSKNFNALTVVFGFGGTTPDDYVNFLRSKDGENFYTQLSIDKPIIVWNIGGNSVLQKRMNTCQENLRIIKNYFPDSYIINIPPIHVGVFEALNIQTNGDLLTNIGTVNGYLNSIWGPKVIDFSSRILNPITGEAVYGLLQDPVHYAEKARKEIVKIINEL